MPRGDHRVVLLALLAVREQTHGSFAPTGFPFGIQVRGLESNRSPLPRDEYLRCPQTGLELDCTGLIARVSGS